MPTIVSRIPGVAFMVPRTSGSIQQFSQMGGSGSGQKRRHPDSDPARLEAKVGLVSLFNYQRTKRMLLL
jgi:hypothetical protein